MLLTNEFTVPLDPDAAWGLLTNIEKIVPCMPGAELTSAVGNNFEGTIKIKVGPINAVFSGTAILMKNEAEHKAVILVDGSDNKGQGFAKGNITATIVPIGTGSIVRFVTDVIITGRMASFGRNVMSDISDKLFSQFVKCIERDILYG